MKNLLHISASEGLCNCRIKQYPNAVGEWVSVEQMISQKKIFNPSGLEKEGYENKGKFDSNSCVETDSKSSEEQSDNDRALRRARSKILDIIRCNLDFRYFCTLTYNGECFARDDYKSVVASFSRWCDNRVRRKGLKYVAVIERHHQSNGLHFHVLCNSVLSLVDSGTVSVPQKKKPIRVSSADRYKIPAEDRKVVYNISDWSYGFSTAIEITGDPERIKTANYLRKYLTKDSEKIGGRYYYSGGALVRPRFLYTNADFYDCEETYYINVPGNTIKVVKI